MFFVGLAVLTVAMVSNLQWSMQDYGLKSISLSKQILAQDSDGWWDTVTGTVSDWYDSLKEYDSKKTHMGITKIVKTTSASGGSIGISPGGITGSVSNSNSTETTQIYYLNECQKGTSDIFCSDSWDYKPTR